jgi:EPS-associated MarR family transcriptional regulator
MNNNNTITTEDSYKILNLFDKEDISNQRDVTGHLGYSLGKVNYLIKSLIEKGFVKLDNFYKSDNKLGYRYILTPAGIEAKYRVTVEFLNRKEAEYERLKSELDEIRNSLSSVENGN